MSAEVSPSPRPSLSARSPSSSRTSLDAPASNTSTLSRPANARRNRAALRDYYGIKSAREDSNSNEGAPPTAQQQTPTILSELDEDGFEAGTYVKNVLERESLENVLKVEGALVNEIRGLDGERKALVYDNYSKLIAATDTIQKMRTNMDPLTPATSTLAPAISHIAETASTLSKELAEHASSPKHANTDGRAKEVQTVRWVLDAPHRFRYLLDNDRKADVEEEWTVIKDLLDKWKGVEGATEVKRQCEQALSAAENGTPTRARRF